MEIEKIISEYYKSVPETEEGFMKAVDTYFARCKGEPLIDEQGFRVLDRFGNVVYQNKKIPTVSGLSLALGLKTRKALLNYAKNGEFKQLAQIALTMLEEYAEMRLYDKNGQRGAVFSLCNSFDNWSQLDKDDKSTQALERLDAILEQTKKNAIDNGTNKLLINGEEVVIDVEADNDIKEEEKEEKPKITSEDVKNGMIGS